MSNERIDSAMAEKILQGDDTGSDILQSLGLELLAELKRCYEEIDYLNALTNNLPVEMLVEAEQNLQASE